MINDVRNTVLAILNKDNNGYITPEEFNLFAKNAQREIFEQYFHDYSLAINKINAQMHSSGYADIPGRLREVIEKFSDRSTLTYNISSRFELPEVTDSTVPSTYSIGTIIYNDSVEVEQISAPIQLQIRQTTSHIRHSLCYNPFHGNTRRSLFRRRRGG